MRLETGMPFPGTGVCTGCKGDLDGQGPYLALFLDNSDGSLEAWDWTHALFHSEHCLARLIALPCPPREEEEERMERKEHRVFHECFYEPRVLIDVPLDDILEWVRNGGCEHCGHTDLTHVLVDVEEA